MHQGPLTRNGRPIPGGSFIGGRMIPHTISINVGEDVKGKILSFSQGRLATVILSGFGPISAINIKGSNFVTRTYEGRYDILTLVGSFTRDDPNSARGPVGGLSASLAGPDGHVIGGTVQDVMIAAGPVQVVVGTLLPYISRTKKNAGKRPGTNSADSEDRPVGNLVCGKDG